MSKPARPSLKFETIDGAIADVKRLRATGYVPAGKWSLPQVCWHVGKVLDLFVQPSTATEPTPEQLAIKKGFYAKLAVPGGASALKASPDIDPPATVDETAIDAFVASLRRLEAYPAAVVSMGPLGPAPLTEAIWLHLAHAAHHLSFLMPKAERRQGLRYAGPADVIADIHRLRNGYAQAGNWTLEQACWHLNVATRSRMRPGPFEPNTPEQTARAPMLAKVLAEGLLPTGLTAPDTMVPPTDADATAIGQLLEVIEQVKTYAGPFAPHRLFGHLSADDSRRLIFIHCAHHLSHLVPTQVPAPREGLRYDSASDVIADVERLRKGHVQAGRWTLAQAAWHVGLPLRMCMRPVSPDATSSPEQQATKASRLDTLLAAGVMPAGVPIAPGTDPITESGGAIDDGEIDRFLAQLRKWESFAQERVNFGPFGIVSNDEFRRFNLLHAANHLRNFIATT
jgi:hypothetical protein